MIAWAKKCQNSRTHEHKPKEQTLDPLGCQKNLHLVVVVEAGFKLKVGHQLSVVVVGNVDHPVPENFGCFSHYHLCPKTLF